MKFSTFAAFSLIIFLNSVHAKQSLNVGLFSAKGFPPLFFSAKSNDKGIYDLILKEISLKTGIQFNLKKLPAKRLQLYMKSGKLDIEMGVTPNWRPQYKDLVVYSNPFFKGCDSVIFRKDDAGNYDSTSVLKNKRAILIHGYYYPYLQDLIKNKEFTINRVYSEKEIVNSLNKRQIGSFGVISRVWWNWYLKSNKVTELQLGKPIDCVKVSFAIHNKKEKYLKIINKALLELEKEGKVREIINKFNYNFN